MFRSAGCARPSLTAVVGGLACAGEKVGCILALLQILLDLRVDAAECKSGEQRANCGHNVVSMPSSRRQHARRRHGCRRSVKADLLARRSAAIGLQFKTAIWASVAKR